MTMLFNVKEWIFDKLEPHELTDLAYELGRQFPKDAMRGIQDARLERARAITDDTVLSIVGEHYHVQPKHICGQGRQRRFTAARKAACELMRHGLGMSLEHIGDVLGGRDHTTIMYALETVDIEAEPFRRAVEDLTRMGLHYDRT